MPIPPAAFSPLITTKSASSRRAGSSARSARRPARPTTSPMKRMAVIPGSYRRSMAQHTDEEAANPLAGVGEPPPVLDTPARVEPVLVPRWVQLVMLPLAVVGAYLLLKAAGSVLLLFIIAGLIALLLTPLVM